MTHDDVLFRFRLRLFALAEETHNVRAACKTMGVHPSTYYRWRRGYLTYGVDALRPRERRLPRMPNYTPAFVEQRVLAFSLAYPGLGPQRIAAELAHERWGGIRLSAHGVWNVLRRHGLNTRKARLGLVAGYAAPPELDRPAAPPARHIEAQRSGELVQMDCFHVGRLSGVKGTVWQYTAIDVHSSYCWAELHVSSRTPRAQFASALASRVAKDLAARGWKLETVMTDNGSEFRSREFDQSLLELGVRHRFIHAGRPTANGCVERVQRTILEECWRTAFARYLIPKFTGLRRDLARYLHYYNQDRAHTGRNNRGRTPDSVLGKAKIWSA
jgi:transposase InsO family protein